MSKKLNLTDQFLLGSYAVKLNSYRKIVDAILYNLTPKQLKTLKGRLMFDPRKLPLTFDAAVLFHIEDVEETKALHDKFKRVLDEFKPLATAEQIAELTRWGAFAQEQHDQMPLLEDKAVKALVDDFPNTLNQYLQQLASGQ